jgi:hypothetical protein
MDNLLIASLESENNLNYLLLIDVLIRYLHTTIEGSKNHYA